MQNATSSNTTVNTCFNCNASGCRNFGTCTSGACSCSEGLGDVNCGKPTCGSITKYNQLRPIRPDNTTCRCDDGFIGPNCNICDRNDVCNSVPGRALGTNYVCNQSPRPWAAGHHAYCRVESNTISALFPGTIGLSLKQNAVNSSAFGILWIDNQIQFSCSVTKCRFASSAKEQTITCQNLQCDCNLGSKFCGGGAIDLTAAVNGASGGLTHTCSSNSTGDCNIKFDFLAGILPDGVDLRGCKFGECADELLAPGNDNSNAIGQFDTVALVGTSISGTFLLLVFVLIALGLWERRVKRLQPYSQKNQRVDLVFKDITYEIGSKKILDNISGSAHPGSLLAIVGPSGSGKTTLLDILAQKAMKGKVGGNITANFGKVSSHSLKRLIGYVHQDDLFFPTLTVRETLEFSAALRLPESISIAERASRVDHILDMLYLKHVADSLVGDSFERGISGGEKRRLSIGVELVTDPSILLLDEPTSGLDSYNASQVVKCLSRLCKQANKTILCTIHQPRSDIFALFDHVLLLSSGKLGFSGLSSSLTLFMEKIGHPCPPGYNMADHLIDLASNSEFFDKIETYNGRISSSSEKSSVTYAIENTTSLSRHLSGSRTLLTIHPAESGESLSMVELENKQLLYDNSEPALDCGTTTSFMTQFCVLFKRQWLHFWRKPSLFLFHFFSAILLGGFLGGLYWQVDSSLGGIQNRLGSIFFLQSLIGFSSLSAIGSFAEERIVFLRERSNKYYGSSPFFIVKVLFDLIPLRIIPSICMCSIAYYMIGYTPALDNFGRFVVVLMIFSCNCGLYCLMIGSIFRNFGTASLIASITMLFHMLFAGILVNQVQIPFSLRWIQYLSFFKYAYEAMVVNDSISLKFVDEISGVKVTVPASYILSKFGLDITAFWRDFAICIGITVLLLIIICVIFRFKLKDRR